MARARSGRLRQMRELHSKPSLGARLRQPPKAGAKQNLHPAARRRRCGPIFASKKEQGSRTIRSSTYRPGRGACACVRSAGRRKRSESALGRLAAGRKPAGPRSLSSADARPFGPALGRPQAGPFDRRVRAGWRRPVRRHGLGGKRRSASSPKAANPSSRSARRRSASQNEIRVSPAAPNRRPRPTRATGCGGGLLSPGAAPGRRPAGGLAGVSAFGPFGPFGR